MDVAELALPAVHFMLATVKAATAVAAGQAAAGVVSVKVAALTEGVLRTMLLTKLKIATTLLLILVLGGAASVVLDLLPVGRGRTTGQGARPTRRAEVHHRLRRGGAECRLDSRRQIPGGRHHYL